MTDFVHLHVHSNMSFMDAMPKPDDLAKRAAKLGMPAIALTDHGHLFGTPDFARACEKHGVKPIFGCEFYQVKDATKRSHEVIPSSAKGWRRHITVLSKNKTGWKNLMKLSSESYTTGYYYKPRTDFKTIVNHQDGLFVMSGCISSELSQTAGHMEYEDARDLALYYQKYLGDRYYLEMTALDRNDFREKVYLRIARIHEETGIPMVVTGDVHYLEREESPIHAFLTKMGPGKANYKGFRCDELWLKDRDEMWDTFVREWRGVGLKQNTVLNAIDQTTKIASQCEKYSIEPEHSIDGIQLRT